MNNSKLINPAPIIKKLVDRCLVAKGLECSILGELIDLLKAAQAVDAVEVVHGRWVDLGRNYYTVVSQCSECGSKYDFRSPYCPNCGAKMDGERKDNGNL